MRKFIVLAVVLLGISLSPLAQTIRQVPGQVYRFIKFSGDDRAGNIRWIEIWDTQTTAGDLEWTMIDNEWMPGVGIETQCYYATAIGNGTPLYVEDGELQPIETRDQLLQELENRRLVLNSEFYVNDNECTETITNTINGISSASCVFEDQDASGIFLIKSPATSVGTLWRAIDGDYPVRYDFAADGSSGDVEHRYELFPNDSITIEQPDVSNLLCFDGAFPIPESTSPASRGSLTFTALQSDLSTSELQTFYDNALSDTWNITGNRPNGGRVYSRELDGGSICTLEMRFRESPNGKTGVTASVFPEEVNLENLEVTDEFTSPVVIQSYASVLYTERGAVQEIVNRQVSQQGEDWFIRDDLTDIREDSAFVVLAQADSQQEIYITVDRLNDEESTVQVQTRAGVCGPTFDTASR
jgi:hypothetical protein